MRGVSRTSYAEAAERLESLLDRTPDSGERARLGSQLFQVADLFDSSVALRRAMTDPARKGEDKAGLMRRLLEGKVSSDAVDLLSGVGRAAWSTTRDLGDAIELLAVDATLAAAEAENRLDRVEQEVHRAGQVITGDAGLRRALLERLAPARSKAELVGRLVDEGTAPESSTLVRRMASHPRGRRPEAAFEVVAEAAARRRQRLVAHVTVAVWPSDEQLERLSSILARTYGREIRLAVDLEPEVIGGMRVQVGDEVLDGTVSRRLAAAAEQLGR